MKKTIILMTMLVLLQACKEKPEQPLEQASLDKVCTQAFRPFYDARNHVIQHRVAFTGYLRIPRSVMMSDTMLLDITEKPDGTGAIVSVSFRIGSGKNKAERLPESYREGDLKVEGEDGSSLTHGSKVSIEGDRGGTPGTNEEKGCYVKLKKISKAP